MRFAKITRPPPNRFEFPLVCAGCGEDKNIRETAETERWELGPGIVKLQATVPVVRCDACGLAFTDWRGEEIRELISNVFMPWVYGAQNDEH